MRLVPVLVIWCICGPCFAQSIHAYKSVHGDGSVTYSDTRPASVSSVETIRVPGTDAAVVEAGQKRKQEMDAIAERLAKQRDEDAEVRRKYESRLADAREAVRSAEASLASILESKKSATQERIALAEQKLKLARKQLRDVQRAGPGGDNP